MLHFRTIRLDGQTVNARECRRSRVQIPAGQILHSMANGTPPLHFKPVAVVLPWCYVAEMCTANSLYASANYGEYNKK